MPHCGRKKGIIMKLYHQIFKNKQGSVLQIVLILFMILTLSLTMTTFSLLQSARQLQTIDILMKQKNLEISLVKYYSDCVQTDLLLSDSYDFQNYQIETTVDDLGDYYEVTTNIEAPTFQYSFLTKIEVQTGVILNFEYI